MSCAAWSTLRSAAGQFFLCLSSKKIPSHLLYTACSACQLMYLRPANTVKAWSEKAIPPVSSHLFDIYYAKDNRRFSGQKEHPRAKQQKRQWALLETEGTSPLKKDPACYPDIYAL